MQRMDEWPAWQRWCAFAAGWLLYLGGFAVLIEAGGIPLRVIALAVLFGGLWVLAYAGKAVLNERMRKVDRWKHRVVLPTMIVYIVLMLYVWPMYARIAMPWLKTIVVLLPLLPLAVVIWAMTRYVAHCDELERRQHLEAVGISAAIVSLASFAFGLLAATRLIVVNGALVLLLVFPALCFVYGLGCAWTRWRNRAR